MILVTRHNVATLLMLALLSRSAAALDYYVNNVGGDDLQNGRAPLSTSPGTGPCRTIFRTLKLVQKGDRIILANTGEPYRECITLQGGRHSGTKERPFTLIGNGATISGAFVIPDRWKHLRGEVFRFDPRMKRYQQLFLDGQPVSRVPATRDGRMPSLNALQWTLFDRAIHLRVEPGRIPTDYNLSYARHTVGITLYEVRNVVIRDVLVEGFQLDGVNAHDNVFHAALRNSTIRSNGRSGVSVGGASRFRIDGCAVSNNGAAQVRTEGYSITTIVKCDLSDQSAPKIVRQGGRVIVENGE